MGKLKVPLTLGNNPWTRGLKFFTVLDNTYNLRNYVFPGLGTSTKPTDQDPVFGTAGYPGLNFEDANGEFIDWDRTPMGPTTGSVTVVGRFKPTAGKYGAILGSMLDPGLTGGFILQFHAVLGLTMFVAHGGGVLGAATSDPTGDSGYEYTAGGSYNSITRSMTLWKDGKEVATGSDNSQPWNSVATAELYTGRSQFTNLELDGPVFWVAYFDRALTDAEMAVWTSQDPLGLILAEEMTLIPGEADYVTGNVIDVDQTVIADSPYTLFTFLTAGAATGGDIPSSGGGGFAQLNNVNVQQLLQIVETIPSLSQNTILVDQTVTFVELFNTSNVVGVGSFCSLTLADQPNVLVGNRYRR